MCSPPQNKVASLFKAGCMVCSPYNIGDYLLSYLL